MKAQRREPELEVLRGRPKRPLNLNVRNEMDGREKFMLTLSSSPFVFAASLLTFGGYYVYHKYRINERRQQDKVKILPDLKRELAEGGREFREFHSLLNFSDNLNELMNGRPVGPSPFLQKLNGLRKSLLMTGGVVFTGFLCSLEKIFSKLTRRSLDFDPFYDISSQRLEQHVESERRLLAQMSRLLNPTPPTIRSSFDLDSRIVRSLVLESEKKMVSHYMKVIFLWFYLLLSVLSLGLVPLLNKIKRRCWGFPTIAREEFNVGVSRFNGGLGRLLNCEEFGQFSEFLTREDYWGFSNNVVSDLFRTEAFRSPRYRLLMVHVISLMTLGFFPFLIHLCRFMCGGFPRTVGEEEIRPFRPKNPPVLGRI